MLSTNKYPIPIELICLRSAVRLRFCSIFFQELVPAHEPERRTGEAIRYIFLGSSFRVARLFSVPKKDTAPIRAMAFSSQIKIFRSNTIQTTINAIQTSVTTN
ncbi:hypothetical protein SGQ44_15360 [Flavobacterium sp. Fl-77]|uniref:Uncharacterized protein n=1 Tax=Flavobacterium flavipigmentatum TaxID=2893884 RepID=A0AAJ2SIM3_9FLAO|nr:MULTISPECIES: hypothetical protein [unclassified Flavobacterium]MDX6183589.1 hypothetical protein [Flavobacterium sp. Fl-33]MDX6187141.1 hypothetical protein [Flavobacterium sp. Fl-77]UFH38048.1 hypothetical protein LNP22_15070 [Flavobacterium sp. F-70]